MWGSGCFSVSDSAKKEFCRFILKMTKNLHLNAEKLQLDVEKVWIIHFFANLVQEDLPYCS